MLTLGEARNSRLKRIAGVCTNGTAFIDLVNDATRELMRRGNFWTTVKRMTTCIYDNCIVWPRHVGTVLALNRCNHSIPPKNYWYSFDAVLADDIRSFGPASSWDNRTRGPWALEDIGITPVFSQPPCLNPRYLIFYPSRNADVGKKITVFGIDEGGNVIRTTHADGIFQDGVELTLAKPYVQTPMLVRAVERIIKEPTEGEVYGYQFDGATKYNLAHYQPSETLPEYRFTKIQGCWNNTAACGRASQITALIKLTFIPVRYDDDLVLIDNIDALAKMVQAVKEGDAYEIGQEQGMMLMAVRELNHELRDKMPNDAIPTRVRYDGTAGLNRGRFPIGRIF
jgi:hypothetical protein